LKLQLAGTLRPGRRPKVVVLLLTGGGEGDRQGDDEQSRQARQKRPATALRW